MEMKCKHTDCEVIYPDDIDCPLCKLEEKVFCLEHDIEFLKEINDLKVEEVLEYREEIKKLEDKIEDIIYR